jgi:hypothetical protein
MDMSEKIYCTRLRALRSALALWFTWDAYARAGSSSLRAGSAPLWLSWIALFVGGTLGGLGRLGARGSA